jgi:hypothetical protein
MWAAATRRGQGLILIQTVGLDPNQTIEILPLGLFELGGTVIQGSPADFGVLISAETEKWAKVVIISGARAD